MNTSAAADKTEADIDWWSLLNDRAFLIDPYPHLERLQSIAPVHFDGSSGIFFILGHREFVRVATALQMGRDTRHWTNGWCTDENKARDPLGYRLLSEFQPQMINSNPPDHGRMRGSYEQAFKAGAIAAHTAMVQREARQLLDEMPFDGRVDLMAAYAAPLPLRVLRNLFEMPAEMDGDISRWSAALIKIGDVLMTPVQKQEAHDALLEFKTYLQGHLKLRARNPGEGMIGGVIRALEAHVLNEEETLTNLVSMLVAGHETTVTLIGNGLLCLLRHPDQFARLRAEPALLRSAIEEFLRYEPGGNMILRVATEDLQVGGVTIPKGAAVLGMIGAINRDPARFEDPGRFDIARRPNPHLTFGAGIHLCIGAHLARLEAQLAFEALLDRYPHIELDGQPEWRLDRINARGLHRLPLRVRAQ
ncbi:MAG TPA: cytochrome P450 [Bryobacteraceae bacterium]|nr:cytochrome P450 [Bryobacteraceae bacterium]